MHIRPRVAAIAWIRYDLAWITTALCENTTQMDIVVLVGSERSLTCEDVQVLAALVQRKS
jgi:hypothetical protein